MNDLGLTLAWLAVQVALVLVPALALHALASRRSPAAGAWVAALSLGLVVVLNAAAFLPGIGRGAPRRPKRSRPPRRRVRPMPRARQARPVGDDAPVRPSAGSWSFAGLRFAWDRLERGRPSRRRGAGRGASMLAVVALAGTGVGSAPAGARARGGRRSADGAGGPSMTRR